MNAIRWATVHWQLSSVLAVPMNTLNREAIAKIKLSPREADRCKSFFALGLMCWLFDKPLEPTLQWIVEKFAKNPAVLEGNGRTMHAGYQYGETAARRRGCACRRADLPKGTYRRITGNEALVLGLVAAAESAKLHLVFAGTPAVPPATSCIISRN